jgi:hypothetical protein
LACGLFPPLPIFGEIRRISHQRSIHGRTDHIECGRVDWNDGPLLARQRRLWGNQAVNGSKLGGWQLSFGVEAGELVARVPRALVPEDGNLRITFIIKDPVSPKELGISDDYRRLGLGLRKMSLGWAGE